MLYYDTNKATKVEFNYLIDGLKIRNDGKFN